MVASAKNGSRKAVSGLALLLCLAKNIIVNDRITQLKGEGKYNSGPGFELRGKTLGVIGLGQIGSRVAELGQAIGMKVIVWNRTPKKQKDVQMKSLTQVLSQSDALSFNLSSNKETRGFISRKEIKEMKPGVIIVNLIGPSGKVVDKKAMVEALKSGKVAFYAYEGEDLKNNPLAKIKTAIGLKGFAWYTKDALERAMVIWTDSIISIAKYKPVNVV